MSLRNPPSFSTAGGVDSSALPANYIPSKHEIQQMLVDAGYDICEDGVDGKIGGKTKTAWDEAVFNQYAAEYMTPTGKPKGNPNER